MNQFELDKLVEDIQGYLRNGPEQGGAEAGFSLLSQPGEASGSFMASDSRKKMERFLKVSRVACYLVEALTIALLTTVIIAPFENWSSTLFFIAGTLLFGIFTVSVLLGMQARIRLLLRIELNTERIASSKMRIATVLEKMHLD